MKLAILDNYDKIIKKRPGLIVKTNTTILALSTISLLYSSSVIIVVLLSMANLVYVAKTLMFVLNKKKKNNLNIAEYSNKDLKFLASLAYLYNIEVKELNDKLSKKMLSKDNIGKAFKEKAKILHPDMKSGCKLKFQELNNHKQFIDDYLFEFHQSKKTKKYKKEV